MKIDIYGQQIYTEQELIDRIMRGHSLAGSGTFLTSSDVDTSTIRWMVDKLPAIERYTDPGCTVEEFDSNLQQQWLMPEHYRTMDIVKHALDLCENEAELQRAGEELLLYAERNLLDLLKFLVYLVDTMKQNDVIWGVGRGSSVSSFVLYLIGVHRINSLYYDLDVREFLR